MCCWTQGRGVVDDFGQQCWNSDIKLKEFLEKQELGEYLKSEDIEEDIQQQ